MIHVVLHHNDDTLGNNIFFIPSEKQRIPEKWTHNKQNSDNDESEIEAYFEFNLHVANNISLLYNTNSAYYERLAKYLSGLDIVSA